MESLSARNIKRDLSHFEGHSRNNRLKVWRSLCSFWDEAGEIEVNVARQVFKSTTEQTQGHTPWTREGFAAFRAFWPIGTKQRFAFELTYRTCATIGDACNLTRGQINDGWLTHTRQKSKSAATCPFSVAGPAWFETTGDLDACLPAEPRHLTYMTTMHG